MWGEIAGVPHAVVGGCTQGDMRGGRTHMVGVVQWGGSKGLHGRGVKGAGGGMGSNEGSRGRRGTGGSQGV